MSAISFAILATPRGWIAPAVWPLMALAFGGEHSFFWPFMLFEPVVTAPIEQAFFTKLIPDRRERLIVTLRCNFIGVCVGGLSFAIFQPVFPNDTGFLLTYLVQIFAEVHVWNRTANRLRENHHVKVKVQFEVPRIDQDAQSMPWTTTISVIPRVSLNVILANGVAGLICFFTVAAIRDWRSQVKFSWLSRLGPYENVLFGVVVVVGIGVCLSVLALAFRARIFRQGSPSEMTTATEPRT